MSKELKFVGRSGNLFTCGSIYRFEILDAMNGFTVTNLGKVLNTYLYPEEWEVVDGEVSEI